jgi:type IV pilus assembly protein PilE
MKIFEKKPHKISGFTMAEVLFALAIIGIAVSIAIPIFAPTTTKAKATEAQIQLQYIYNLQTQYRYVHSKYSFELGIIDFEAPKSVNQGGSANYQYEIIEATTTTFKARAEAVIDFDGDGQLNLWEINENGIPSEILKD